MNNHIYELYRDNVITTLKQHGWTDKDIGWDGEIEETIHFCFDNGATVADCVWVIEF